ncbi:hypothetical protein [Capnocytophaga catalasegens]|uniref:Uncharacterized protein n=1 Tax=Capnocytophaga catalasegens TaxID=1004260 RepID=A0AAV5AXX2_9FLAO|nr:hypothetical protein [Capnocytophaga catalasegens]GIZ15520.1 hypothetical protein RCZ03_15200 [Capnocytophaga catalasegens]GJM49863.1 hypothetical protein RCZ15_08380 [Capnocytophaga catalasegens]GJM54035.1 hypothetical protein RCZ16_23510 [Capnocytophaga catalasegens]
MKTSKILKIGKYNISSTKELARLVQIKGKTKTCEFLHYMKSIVIDSDLQTVNRHYQMGNRKRRIDFRKWISL